MRDNPEDYFDEERPLKVRRTETDSVLDGYTENELVPPSKMDKSIYLAATEVSDHIIANLFARRIDALLDTRFDQIEVVCIGHSNEWHDFVATVELQSVFPRIIQYQQKRAVAIWEFDANNVAWIKTFVNGNGLVDIEFAGSYHQVKLLKEAVLKKYKEKSSSIDWIYSTQGHSVTVQLRDDRQPITEMYPFLGGEELSSYYDRFMESNASILLLIGPPGTGKTSFIRGLIQHTKSDAMVSYDQAILERDVIFAGFIEDPSTQIFVMEDADALLMARKEGNSMMHKFLNVGDGLVTVQGKKMIFSTNLDSIKDVDPALIRPGRCFDILTFTDLSAKDATVLCKKLGMPLPAQTKVKYSLAELFHTQVQAKTVPKKSMGFI